MSDLTIHAQARTVLGKQTKTLRHQGSLPAVLYGHGLSSRPLTIKRNEFQRVYKSAGESTLVDLALGDETPVKAIIQEVQRHPVSGAIIHVDLHQVKMTEKLHTEIPLNFIGDAPAVKELGGVLVKNVDEIEVEALPSDLVHEITIDISILKTFDDMIRVKDVTLPKGISLLDNPDDVVCLVTPPRSEQELAELEQKVEEKVEEVEGVKPEEPPAEGETAPGEDKPEAEAKSEKK